MSIQWQFASTILTIESALVVIFCLPFISNKFWNRIFKWKLLSWVGHIGQHAFLVVASILAMLFMESIREIQKYEKMADETIGSAAGYHPHQDPHTNKFRAQRNFYITLGAFLLWVVLRRLITLISAAAQLEASEEAMKKQAQQASKMAETLLNSGDDDKDSTDSEKKLQQEIESLKTKLSEARSSEAKVVEDLEVLKKQSKATEKEYDRLMGELEREQAKNDSGDKKDD